MVSKPPQIPNWATNNIVDPTSGQPNVVTPPPEKQTYGWSFKEFPPRQWFNWLGRYTAQWINWFNQQESQSVVTDGNGLGLFLTDTALITLYAVSKNNPTSYIVATGYKAPGVAPVLNVVSSSVLTLGVGTIAGDQPISGASAANVIVYGQTKVIPS